MAMISCDQFKEQDLLPVVSWVGVEKYMFLLSRCLTAQKSHYVIKALFIPINCSEPELSQVSKPYHI